MGIGSREQGWDLGSPWIFIHDTDKVEGELNVEGDRDMVLDKVA